MAKGIGIDMVSISETARRLASEPERPGDIDTPNAFTRRTFTADELACARQRRNPARFLAGRLAVKRAARKALAPLLAPAELAALGPRSIETLTAPSGAPLISAAPISDVLRSANSSALLVSISNEGDLAVAMVLVK